MSEEQKVESEESATEETKDQPNTNAEETEALLSALEKFNVKTPAQLQGHLTNARDYHKIQSERDALANKLKGLEDKLDNLNRRPQNDWEDDQSQYGQPLNIEESFINALRKYEGMKQEENMRLQQQQLEAYDSIVNDPNYPQVKEVWEERLKDPRFLADLNSGRKHPRDAYKDLVIENQKSMLVKAAETLKALHSRPDIKTPHVEQTVKGGVPQEEKIDKNKEMFKKVRAEVESGRRLNYDEELALLDGMLSGGAKS